MQIAFCIFKYFPHGGIQRDLLKICRECLSRGAHVRIYAIQWRDETASDSPNQLFPPADLQFESVPSNPHNQAERDRDAVARPSAGESERFATNARAISTGKSEQAFPALSKDTEPCGLEICLTPARALSRHRLYERFAERVRQDLSARPVDLVVGMNKMPGLDVYYAGDSCYQEKARAQRGFLYRLLPRYRSFLRSERAVFEPMGHTEILTISTAQAPIFQHYYGTPPARFHLLPPGIERDRTAPPNRRAVRARMRANLGIDTVDRLLLFVGSGFVKKGLDRLLTGMRALPRELLDRTHLIVLGDDNSTRFARIARRLSLGDRVRFLGGRDDVPEILLAGDGLALPAFDETAGMVILEAMIAGLPALVTENCGYAGYLRDAGAGLITPAPFRQQTFNEQLAELLTSPQRECWSNNGMAVAQDENIFAMAPTAVNLLEHFATSPGRPRPARSRPETGSNRHRRAAARARLGVKTKLFLRADVAGPRSARQLLNWAETVEGEIYRRVRGRITRRVLLDGKPYFLKSHSGVGWLEILKNASTGKRAVLGAENEFRACRHLRQRGIPAPEVAAFAATGGNPATRRSVILCDELVGFVSLETVMGRWDESPPDPILLRRLVLGVAHFVRRLHAAGVVHRDLYVCHLWLHTDAWAAGEVRLAVLDLHRARLVDPMPDYWRKRDLAALLFSAFDAPLHPHAWLRFVRVYSGCSLREAFATRGSFWQSVQRRARRLYEKGARKGLVKHRNAQ